MGKVAFELRSEYASGENEFTGGVIGLQDGTAFDVKEALEKGGGKIVLDPTTATKKDPAAQEKENVRARNDGWLAQALDSYGVLKRVAASSPKKED